MYSRIEMYFLLKVESFKSSIKTTCENLNSEIERFALHWDQFKPRPGSGQIATDSLKNLEQYLLTLREKKEQWSELLKQKESLEYVFGQVVFSTVFIYIFLF